MTKIFLDSGDPLETKKALSVLGFLDGQTTNPSLVAKNPQAMGKKFTQEEISSFYKNIVQEIYQLIPEGSVSIEVYSDLNTTAEEMLNQAREFWKWIPNPGTTHSDGNRLGYGAGAHIKYPTTKAGLEAAEISIKEGMRVNMTLVFTQEQAAAVYAATKGAKKGDVFVSPFIGRLDSLGLNGMDLIKNILEMYKLGDGHVEVLAASTRSLWHISEVFKMGVDIVTMPINLVEEWRGRDFSTEVFKSEQVLIPINYQQLNLNASWDSFNIEHELTTKGLIKFAEDWNNLIE